MQRTLRRRLIYWTQALCGDVLWDSAVDSTLVTRAVCSRGAPSVNCMGPSDVAGLTSVVILAGWAGPQSRWLLDSASSGGC